MTALEQLTAYLRRLELRLRLLTASRGTALVAALALILTVLLVYIANRYAFARHIVFPLRILLFLALAAAISFLLALPLFRLNRRRVTRLAERQVPGFEERLLTIAERPDPQHPFTELIAEDALRVARDHQPEQLTPTRSLLGFLGSGAVVISVLLWLIAAGPGYWGYGASLLWTGAASPGKRPLYEIGVQPGNKTIRRKSDQMITAQLFGFSAHRVTLHAKYGSALKWEETGMQPRSDGNGYQFLFAGLSDAVEYYVQADAAQSKRFTINVKDLPGVKRVRVALRFPSGLGLKDVVQDPGGDVRAVEGSQADISVLTDRPLEHGLLVLENGSKVELARAEGNWLTAHLAIKKDGSYHVAALDGGEAVRISDDYFIEAKKDEPPSVKILRPGHDPRVSPIEEVPVTVDASDDFGVQSLELHYSVNGGPEQVVPLLKTKGAKEAEGTTTLYFENFKAVPGDLVSFYATARDANTTSRSDIIFAQTEPFDFKFTQSQQMGGGMGGMGMGNQDTGISERQKQVIAATFNELRNNDKSRAALDQDARFLSDMEGKLGEQAKTLADRMASRELGSTNAAFENLSKLMTQASSQMSDAATQLKPGKWHDALTPEQKALQSLLRAEALFRDIQVAFGQSGAGMNGEPKRDLARMFDLELDTSKNQYETGQSAAQSQDDQQKAIDQAFERLKMLAQRQQELAAQNAQQKPFEQRWEEEQLRREAEELRQQVQQLAQNSQAQQQSSSSSQNGQQGGSQQSSSSSQPSTQSGRQSNGSRASQADPQSRQAAEALRQTIDALQRAEQEMRKAVTDRDATAEQRAAAQLREAQEVLNQMLHRQAGDSVADLTQRAREIANAQKAIADEMDQMYGAPGSNSRSESESSAKDGQMPEMNDPNSFGYGYGFRRRNWRQLMEPTRPATEQEKAVANDKEKLAQEIEQLERQMQQEMQSMAGSQPVAASKLRRALSGAEQKELALRMQKDAEWMRQGYGDRNLGMQDSVTAGLEQLSRDLGDVQQALNSAKQDGKNGQNDKTAEALAQVRALREQLERGAGEAGRLERDGQDAQGRQPGQQARGEAYNPFGGGGGLDRHALQDAMAQLYGLRTQIDPRDRALYGYIDGVLWNLRHLTGSQAGLLDSRISQDAVISLERLEVELNKRIGHEQAQGARTGAPESSPEKYRDAVAEYFKKLSK